MNAAMRDAQIKELLRSSLAWRKAGHIENAEICLARAKAVQAKEAK